MSKNLIPKIAKMLGVELFEEFKVEGDNRTYWFDLDGLHSGEYVAEDEDDAMLHDLLCGDAEIVKIPWKPKKDEDYYTFGGSDGSWRVSQQHWTYHPFDLALFEKGWVYRTRAEAKSALPKVAAEMGVKYGI